MIGGPHRNVVEDLGVRVESGVGLVGFLDFRGLSVFLKAEFSGFSS